MSVSATVVRDTALAMFTAVQNGVQSDLLTRREIRSFAVKGRLAPGVKTAQARQEIQQLATMKDQGLLTEEEFQAKKKQILGI